MVARFIFSNHTNSQLAVKRSLNLEILLEGASHIHHEFFSFLLFKLGFVSSVDSQMEWKRDNISHVALPRFHSPNSNSISNGKFQSEAYVVQV